MKKNAAFSLIELSVVILIVSILIVGAVESKKFVQKAKLTTARTLTTTSPVNDISGLQLWLETSLDSSFIKAEAANNTFVSTWYDNNPNAVTQSNATAPVNRRPKYMQSGINGLPALQFFADGDWDVMTVAGPYIGSTTAPATYDNYSIFIVAQATTTHGIDTESYSGTGGTSGQNYLIGPNHPNLYTGLSATGSGVSFGTNGISVYEHAGGYMPSPIVYQATLTNPIAILLQYNNKTSSIYVNGTLARTAPSQSAKNYIFPSRTIGDENTYNGTSYGSFRGFVGEVIVFNRILLAAEKASVNNYLTKKWNIS
jgi:prepilin-type N-terminal cleavage/methylation domain-containing protein